MTFSEWLKGIANILREKTGKTDKIKAKNFATEISTLVKPVQLFAPSIFISSDNVMTITDTTNGYATEYEIYLNDILCGTSTENIGYLKEIFGVLTSGVVKVKAKDKHFITSDFSIPENCCFFELTLSNDGTYYIVSSIGTETGINVIIPNDINGIPIKTISTIKSTTIKKLTLGEYLTYSKGKLNGISNLETFIILANNFEFSASYTFENHSHLKVVEMPNVTSIPKLSSYNPFFGCTKLAEIVVPDSVYLLLENYIKNGYSYAGNWETHKYKVISISDKNGMSGLEYTLSEDKKYYIVSGIGTVEKNSIYIKDLIDGIPVEEIKTYAFKDVTEIKAINISKNIKRLGRYIFSGTSVTEITIPETVLEINGSLFQSSISNKVYKIYYNGTLEQWYKIKKYGGFDWYTLAGGGRQTVLYINGQIISGGNLPNTLTEITDYCFCNILIEDEIIIPNGVTKIGKYAFCECTSSILKVIIPKSVVEIGDYAFKHYYGSGIIKIRYDGTIQEWNAIKKGSMSFWTRYGCTVVCSDGTIEI
jgi:hypothetical protein